MCCLDRLDPETLCKDAMICGDTCGDTATVCKVRRGIACSKAQSNYLQRLGNEHLSAVCCCLLSTEQKTEVFVTSGSHRPAGPEHGDLKKSKA